MSGTSRLSLLSATIALVSIGLPSTAEAQFFDKLKEKAEDAAEQETLNQVDRMIRGKVQCVFNDLACMQNAQDSGEEYVLTDSEGEVLVDEEGQPVSDPARANEMMGKDSPPAPGAPGTRPGQGAAVNTDFVAGESTVLSVDYMDDNLGDFPRRFDLIEGSFDIIDWQGERYLRARSRGSFAIVLPETLPDKFTLETAVSVQHGNARFYIRPARPDHYEGSAIHVRRGSAGIKAVGAGPDAMTGHDSDIVTTRVAPLTVMADGEHMKVYLDGNRVANVPNAVFPRSDTLFVSMSSASERSPIVIGPFRIAGSEVDLYDRLARDGRVTTRGVQFDVNSATIRTESAETLEEIGTMLQEHPDLRLSIEGHTDSDGDDAHNMTLSKDRAAAVRDLLIDTFGIEPSRLEAKGFGETVPVAPNDTPEGKQQNRRVELVRL